jgi:hypothetical protein
VIYTVCCLLSVLHVHKQCVRVFVCVQHCVYFISLLCIYRWIVETVSTLYTLCLSVATSCPLRLLTSRRSFCVVVIIDVLTSVFPSTHTGWPAPQDAMPSLHAARFLASSLFKPSSPMSLTTHSNHFFLSLSTPLTPAPPSLYTQSSQLFRST